MKTTIKLLTGQYSACHAEVEAGKISEDLDIIENEDDYMVILTLPTFNPTLFYLFLGIKQ